MDKEGSPYLWTAVTAKAARLMYVRLVHVLSKFTLFPSLCSLVVRGGRKEKNGREEEEATPFSNPYLSLSYGEIPPYSVLRTYVRSCPKEISPYSVRSPVRMSRDYSISHHNVTLRE